MMMIIQSKMIQINRLYGIVYNYHKFTCPHIHVHILFIGFVQTTSTAHTSGEAFDNNNSTGKLNSYNFHT